MPTPSPQPVQPNGETCERCGQVIAAENRWRHRSDDVHGYADTDPRAWTVTTGARVRFTIYGRHYLGTVVHATRKQLRIRFRTQADARNRESRERTVYRARVSKVLRAGRS